MGLIRSLFSFGSGTLLGIYVAQNYNIPNIQGLVNVGILMARQVEQAYRKPSRRKDPEDEY